MSRAIVVVPCFNEASRLEDEAFLEFIAKTPDVRLLMVDDGSADETPARLGALAERSQGRITCHVLPRNSGKAEAVRQGVLLALRDAPDFVGYWDADLATPLSALPGFIEVLDSRPDVRLVLGSRVKLMGREIERRPLRHYLGRAFATAASLTLDLAVYDTQCGAKLLRVDRDTRALFAERFLTGWIFDVELIARLARLEPARDLEREIYELPLRVWRDVPGSKLGLRDFARGPIELMRIARHYRPWQRAHPPAVPSPGDHA